MTANTDDMVYWSVINYEWNVGNKVEFFIWKKRQVRLFVLRLFLNFLNIFYIMTDVFIRFSDLLLYVS